MILELLYLNVDHHTQADLGKLVLELFPSPTKKSDLDDRNSPGINNNNNNNNNPSIHLCIHPYIHPSIHPFIHLYIHPSIHPCIHASIHPSINHIHVAYCAFLDFWRQLLPLLNSLLPVNFSPTHLSQELNGLALLREVRQS